MHTIASIPGIHCAACKALIEDVSNEFPEIESATVAIDSKTVTIDHAPDFDLTSWSTAIEELGDTYTVASLQTER